MGAHQHLPTAAAPVDGSLDTTDRPTDGSRVGEPLPKKLDVTAMCTAFGSPGRPLDPSTFHRHERAGKFERFELRPQIGRKAWSGVLVDRYLACEASASRFVTVDHKSHRRAS